MSSLGRRIQRQVSPSRKVHFPLDEKGDPDFSKPAYANPPRQKFFGKTFYHGGRGSMLGVVNPDDACLLARKRREELRRQRRETERLS